MFTRNASECRAKEPRSCYYHGAIITMNEATERFRATGDPEALDVYYKSRQRVEATEDDMRKQQWLRDADAVFEPETSTTPVAPRTEDKTAVQSRRTRPSGNNGHPSGNGTRRSPSRGQKSNNSTKKSTNSAAQSAAKIPFVAAEKPYDERTFPQQVPLGNEKGEQVSFVRHDKATKVPTGIMFAASRPLSREEKVHLAGLLRYQHTVATRVNGKAKVTPDEDIIVEHSGRSVYIKSQFTNDGKQLPEFHKGLNHLIKEGSPRRQDGSQKYAPFASDVQMAVYYTD